ncbi:MAG TPA: N-methyl-L-tryptophan oxidase [Candidatus Deferrimicrobiaceae bacterium]|nr:N-methyl-L-tryptophan oxidase [Candidatus Deferrimicrobiaceae bacterium]
MSRPSQGGDYDAIVIGLGAIGSAAAYRLAARGAKVLGLEQFELGHDRGASQDESRIIRLSYHRAEYVELAKDAYTAWREVEAAAGERILTITGGLDVGPLGAPEAIEDYAAAMAAAGVDFEWLDTAELVRRWPQWRLDDGTRGLFQAEGGIADPSVGNAAHQRLAREHGAELVEHAKVAAVHEQRGELAVETIDGRRFGAGAVVVAADAWTNDLLAPLGRPLPLRVTREQVTWFEPLDPAAFAPDRFPIWIWLGEPSFYGFPAHRGRGPKVGEDIGGRETTADGRSFEPDLEGLARIVDFVERHLPSAVGRSQTKTCLYTLTPDRDFVLDCLPELPGVVVALGAAHGFKFAALFGRLLADLALEPGRPAGSAAPGAGLFACDRPILKGVASANLVAKR